MLQCILKRINIIIAIAIMVSIFFGTTGQAAQVSAQSTVLVSGTENVRDQLLVEAVLLVKQTDLNSESFDFKNTIPSADGKALFVAIKADKEFEEQVGKFNQNQQRDIVVGLLYTREAFEFQGKKYDRGLHPILLENLDAPLSTSSLGVSIFKQRCTGPCTIQGRRQIRGGGAIVVSCTAARGGSCDLGGNNSPNTQGRGGNTPGRSDVQNAACGLAFGVGATIRFVPGIGPGVAVAAAIAGFLLCF